MFDIIECEESYFNYVGKMLSYVDKKDQPYFVEVALGVEPHLFLSRLLADIKCELWYSDVRVLEEYKK